MKEDSKTPSNAENALDKHLDAGMREALKEKLGLKDWSQADWFTVYQAQTDGEIKEAIVVFLKVGNIFQKKDLLQALRSLNDGVASMPSLAMKTIFSKEQIEEVLKTMSLTATTS